MSDEKEITPSIPDVNELLKDRDNIYKSIDLNVTVGDDKKIEKKEKGPPSPKRSKRAGSRTPRFMKRQENNIKKKKQKQARKTNRPK